MNAHRIVIVADAQKSAGRGHISRCGSLAKILTDQGWNVFLIEDTDPRGLLPEIKKHVTTSDALILDGYGYDHAYENAVMESLPIKLIRIVDMPLSQTRSDAVISHSLWEEDARQMFANVPLYFFGLEYAMVDENFFYEKDSFEVPNHPVTITVCCGGLDVDNACYRIVRNIPSSFNGKINVVTPKENHGAILSDVAVQKGNSNTELFNNLTPKEMANLFVISDVVIASASNVAIEACAGAGGAVIAGTTVPNQSFLYKQLIERNLTLGVGSFLEEETKFSLLLQDSLKEALQPGNSLIKQLAASQKKIIDGKSAERLSQAISKVLL